MKKLKVIVGDKLVQVSGSAATPVQSSATCVGCVGTGCHSNPSPTPPPNPAPK